MLEAREYFHDGLFLGLEFLTGNFTSPNDLRLIVLDAAQVRHQVVCKGCIGIKLVNFERPSYISCVEISDYNESYDLVNNQMITKHIFDQLASQETRFRIVEVGTHVEANLLVVCKEVALEREGSVKAPG